MINISTQSIYLYQSSVNMHKSFDGRKSWLFVGSKRNGVAMANLLSLVQSCRAMNINSQEYLEDIFKRLSAHPHKNLQELLPDQWAANKK